MSAAYLEATKARRTHYALSASSPIPDAKIVEIVQESLKHSPSAFNSQSSRAVVVFGDHHRKTWEFVKTAIKAIVPAEAWSASEARLNGFQGAYGTVLLFEDQDTVKGLQAKLPTYADRFPQWSEHGLGHASQTLWTALELEGLGANLQHYNPLLDADVQKEFNVPENWRLTAQLVFGKPEGTPAEKTFINIEDRVKAIGAN